MNRYVERHFDAEAAERVRHLLSGWEIPGGQNAERMLGAALLCAGSDEGQLATCMDLAETDFRDLLVGAGLADEDWPRVMDREFGPAD
jgi:hypothetical protein